MSAQKHTPGPWEVYVNGVWPGIEAPDASLSIVIFGDTDDAGVRGRGKPEVFANAALIAAAPDLLDALKGCCAKLSRYRQQHPETWVGGVLAEYEAALSVARAAVAKATGGGK